MSDGGTTVDAGAEDHGNAALLKVKATAIRALLKGEIPADLYSMELFRVNLRDEQAVAARIADLEGQLAVQGSTDDGGVPDAGPSEQADAEKELAEARLEVLRLPLARREEVLELEAKRRKADRARAEAAQQAERAEAARREADEQRRRALEAAEQTRDARLRVLANELARVETARAELARAAESVAALRGEVAVALDESTREAFSRADRFRNIEPGSAAAAEFYEDLVDHVRVAELRLDDARARRNRPEELPRYQPDPASAAPAADVPEAEAAQERLAAAVNAFNEDRARHKAEQRVLLDDLVRIAADRLARVHADELRAIELLPDGRRRAVLGLGREGIRQAAMEAGVAWRLVVGARPSPERVSAAVTKALEDPFVLGSLLRTLAEMLVAAWLTRVSMRWVPSALTNARQWAVRRIHPGTARNWLVGALVAVRAVASEVLLVLGVASVFRIAGAPAESVAGQVAYVLVMGLALYRLAVTATHRLLARVFTGATRTLTHSAQEHMLASVRSAGRLVFAAATLDVVLRGLLGRGYLYAVLRDAVGIVTLLVAYGILRSWQNELMDAYLRLRPDGNLSGAVKRHRTTWLGFAVATGAFVVLAVHAAATAARSFLLGYEQVRSTLAFLFRARLERASTAEQADKPDHELAPKLQHALGDLLPADDADLRMAHVPGAIQLREVVERWREGGPNALLVVARAGFGKTTWLRGAGRMVDVNHVLDLRQRILEPAELLVVLNNALGTGAPDMSALARELNEGPLRRVVVDNLHMTFLRTVGGYRAWDALCTLVQATSNRVFWLGSMGHYAHHHVTWAHAGDGAFTQVMRLPRWTEEQIDALVDLRMRAAGFTADFGPLMASSVLDADADDGERFRSTRMQFIRLLWDYAEGSPRSALECWKRSLVPAGEARVHVRLFRSPDVGTLEALDVPARFILAAVVVGDRVSVEHLAAATGISRGRVGQSVHRLCSDGILARDGDVLTTASPWWPEVIRFLRRKHLLEE